ncbi:MAG: prepilin-type N-terminal cleavage/methylation domain-containing protein [Hungatella sp.]
MKRLYRRQNSGFTLLEVLIVIVIMAIMTAIVVPSYAAYIENTKEERYLAETQLVSAAVQVYLLEQHAAGTLNRAQLKKDLLNKSLDSEDFVLSDLLPEGSFTPGAKIRFVSAVLDTGEYIGLIYEVNGYEIDFMRGREPMIKKMQIPSQK